MPDVVYRCGLPVAMCFLAIGTLAIAGGAAVAVTAAVQTLVGIGPAGSRARAYGVTVRLR